MNAKPKKLLALAALTMALAAMPSKAPVFAAEKEISTQWDIVSVDTKTNKATIKWLDTGKTETRDATKVADKDNADPTCVKDGQYLYEVKIGSITRQKTEVVQKDPNAHKWTDTAIKVYDDPKNICESPFHVAVVCLNCNAEKADTRKPATGEYDAVGHDWKISYSIDEEWEDELEIVDGKVVRKDPTYGGMYWEKRVCQVCGKEENESKVMYPAVFTSNEGDTWYEASTNVTKVGYENGEFVVELKDCSKPGVYYKNTAGTWNNSKQKVVKQEKVEVAAHHVAKVPHKFTWDTKKYPSLHVVNGKVVNDSCAIEGEYKETLVCRVCGKEYQTDTKTAPKSNKHTWTKPTKYRSTTANCVTPGVETWDELVCAICGVGNGQYRTKEVKAYGHPEEKIKVHTVTEDGVDATDHHPGYYTSYTVCDDWGVKHDTTIVTIDAKNPLVYDWKFDVVWTDSKSKAAFNSKYDFLDSASTVLAKPYAYLRAVPQDKDLTQDEIDELTQGFRMTVTEDKDKAVIGDKKTLGTRTFVAKIKEGKYSLTALTYDTYDDFEKGYWNHETARTNDKKVAKNPAAEDTQTYKFSDGYVADDDNPTPTPEPKKNIKKAQIEGRITYRGEYSPIPYTVTLDGEKLKENVDFVFTNTQKNTFKVVGSHKVTIEGIGKYEGSAKGKLYIDPAKQKIKVSLSKKTFKASALKKKAASFQITVKNAKGKVTYTSKNKKVTVSKKGEVTLKKGLKAGKYKITVKAAATKNYKAASKTVTFTVK